MSAYLKPQSPLYHKTEDAYFYPLTTSDQIIMSDGSRLNQITSPKAGFIYPLASSVIPDGFLLCDGAAYSRVEYPELFAAIGTMYGAGDGITTFNVPNLVERVPAGSGGNHAVGDMVGEETHTLTVDEMPEHTHNVYGMVSKGNTGNPDYVISGVNYWWMEPNPLVGVTDSVGGSQPHNNMQPTTYIRAYIIATGKDTGVSVADIVMGAQALPLGVEYGGMGATNPADARRNLEITPENIGALSMELLWENERPTNGFAEQSINLNLSQCSELEIWAYRHKSKNSCSIWRIPKNETSILYIANVEAAPYLFQVTSRAVTVTETTINFYVGKVVSYSDSPSDSDDYIVPWKIYGIKGVSA